MSEHPDYEAIRTPDQAEEKIQEAQQMLEELVREHERVKDEKSEAVKAFNADIGEIETRMEGQLRVLDALRDRRTYVEKQPDLPFPQDGDGEHLTAQDGSVLPGEEAFEHVGPVNDPEDAEIIQLLPEHREEAVPSASFMTNGMEDCEPADDGTMPLDDDEIAMLTNGDEDDAVRHYQARTEASEGVALEEVKAWRAAQQPVEILSEKPKRGRRARA